MISKEQLLSSFTQEFETCKHLFSKIPENYDFNYRPNENMRSLIELLQYLTFAPYEFAAALICSDKSIKWKSYTIAEEKAKYLKPLDFPAAMDEQLEKLKILINNLSDEELTIREIIPDWSLNKTLGANLIDMSLKTAVAYRMQLFLYLKMTCSPELHSGDCWYNSD